MQAKKLIFAPLFTVLLLLCIAEPAPLFAGDIILQADAEGLLVHSVETGPQSNRTSNKQMSPGDCKYIELAVKNTASHTFTLTVEAEDILGDSGPTLLEGLWVEVSEGGEVLAEFPAKDGSYTFPDPFMSGSERIVLLKVWLPWEAGNEYQHLKIDLQWKLTAYCGPQSPQKSGVSGTGSTGSWTDLPEVVGAAAQINMQEASVPMSRVPEMPKTGKMPLLPVVLCGILLIAVGAYWVGKDIRRGSRKSGDCK